jgi:threonine aldolase
VPEIADVAPRLRNAKDDHQPRSRLLVVENTHNTAGGRCVPLPRLRELADFVHERGMVLHVDGARLFNAATALGCRVADLAAPADSVMCCLSKGLGAPVGSCLAGGGEFVQAARRVRKALGGGMRQAGVLAAAALVALREGPKLLATDHARAQRFARALQGAPGLAVDPARVETNMVMVDLDGLDTETFLHTLAARQLLCFATRPGRLRFVFHRDQTEADVEAAIAAVREAAAQCLSGRGARQGHADAEPWSR